MEKDGNSAATMLHLNFMPREGLLASAARRAAGVGLRGAGHPAPAADCLFNSIGLIQSLCTRPPNPGLPRPRPDLHVPPSEGEGDPGQEGRPRGGASGRERDVLPCCPRLGRAPPARLPPPPLPRPSALGNRGVGAADLRGEGLECSLSGWTEPNPIPLIELR